MRIDAKIYRHALLRELMDKITEVVDSFNELQPPEQRREMTTEILHVGGNFSPSPTKKGGGRLSRNKNIDENKNADGLGRF